MAARAITGASRRGKSALLRPERSFGAEQAAPPLRVIKFGGSSVGNADAFRGVHKVLRYYAPGGRSKAKVVCVLSAMMGVTDKLISAAEEAAKGNESGSLAMREKLYGLHARTVEDLLFDVHAQVKLKDYVEQILQETFDAQVAAIAEKGELELHRMDAMAAIGETLSNTMMSQYLSSTGTASETVYAHDEFIKTTADAGGASADIDASVPLIRAKLVRSVANRRLRLSVSPSRPSPALSPTSQTSPLCFPPRPLLSLARHLDAHAGGWDLALRDRLHRFGPGRQPHNPRPWRFGSHRIHRGQRHRRH